MTELKEPPKEFETVSPAAALGLMTGIFLYACRFVGCFWALVVKKPGTVGVRAYLLDFFCSVPMFLAFIQNDWYPDKYFFLFAFGFHILFYLNHLVKSAYSQEPIHSHCLGNTRLGRTWDLLLGAALGLGVALIAPFFGAFVMASAVGHGIFLTAIEERDRQRVVKMTDAMLEHEYMMTQFEKYRNS